MKKVLAIFVVCVAMFGLTVVAGAGVALGHYTTEGGYLYPSARTIQIDVNPRGLILSGLMCMMMLAAMDTTIVSTAIPQIVADLGGRPRVGILIEMHGDRPDRGSRQAPSARPWAR